MDILDSVQADVGGIGGGGGRKPCGSPGYLAKPEFIHPTIEPPIGPIPYPQDRGPGEVGQGVGVCNRCAALYPVLEEQVVVPILHQGEMIPRIQTQVAGAGHFVNLDLGCPDTFTSHSQVCVPAMFCRLRV